MDSAYQVLIIFAVVVVVLIKEWIPIGVVGIAIPFILVLLNISTTADAMSYFISEVVVLIPCVYIMGDSLYRVGVADKIGNMILHLASRLSRKHPKWSELVVMSIIILGSGAASLLLPRYGVTGAFMAVVVAVARSTKISRTKLLLVLAMAANIWGNNTLVSTPPNMLANGVLEAAGSEVFGFFEFALIGVPIAVAGSFTLLIMHRKISCNIDEHEMEKTETTDAADHGESIIVPRWQVIVTCADFLIFFVFIMLEDVIDIPGHVSGMFCVAVLLCMRIMTEKHACSIVGWDVAAFCAGIQALGNAVETSGAGNMIAGAAMAVLGNSPSPFLITGVLFILAAAMTQFMSNTGAAGLLFPIGLALAAKLNADPRAVIMAVTMGCGASFVTPMATTSNTMVVGLGNIQFKDFVKTGMPLMIVTTIVCTIGIPLIWPFFE